MAKSRSEGIIVPTALFVAMFVLLLSTVLVAGVTYNLNMSLDVVQSTEYRYLSFGAVNELISDLNHGQDVGTYTKSNPRRTQTAGPIVESWVEPLPGTKDVLVVAQTYSSRQSKPEIVKRLAAFKQFPLTRIYTNVTDADRSQPDPIYYSDLSASGAWSRLPDFPKTRYTEAGALQNLPGEIAGTLPFMCGAPDGSMYGIYVPALDGWDDEFSPAFFGGVPFPVSLPWGQITVNTLVAGGRYGLTIGDLTPIAQVLVNNLTDVTVSKGGVMMKFNHDEGKWNALPPPFEATVVGGELVKYPDNFHVQGGSGSPVAYEGGVITPCFRKGQDTIYRYTEKDDAWTVMKAPGKDVLLLAADNLGNPVVQTGEIQPASAIYFARILLQDLSDIEPRVLNTKLQLLENGAWTTVPNPPSQFFDKNGVLTDSSYDSGRGGPLLGGMVAGENGDFFVCNRPSDSRLVDTIYKYNRGNKDSPGYWEVVPSPPNKGYDPSTGLEVDKDGLPSRLELGAATGGKLLIRIPSKNSPNVIFEQTEGGGYDLLPPVRSEGEAMQTWLSQISGGRKRNADQPGTYSVRATYF